MGLGTRLGAFTSPGGKAPSRVPFPMVGNVKHSLFGLVQPKCRALSVSLFYVIDTGSIGPGPERKEAISLTKNSLYNSTNFTTNIPNVDFPYTGPESSRFPPPYL